MSLAITIIVGLFNLVGLIFGMRGAYLIWQHGLPPSDIEGTSFVSEDTDTVAIEKNKATHAAQSKRGMKLLLVGFALQFIASLISLAIAGFIAIGQTRAFG